jgi:hypothetical protein
MHENAKIPVLKAELEEIPGHHITYKVWCPFCKVYHRHGNVEGHRVAHCNIDTPFERTGYIIALDPEKWMKKNRTYKSLPY